MIPCEYHRPRSLREALELKSAIAGARVIAGGTDLMVRLRGRQIAPPALISLRSVAEIYGVREDEGLHIGATTTFTDLLADPVVARRCPVLAQAAGHVGSPQLRNVGTIGGNIATASPCADTALPLLVLEASARLESAGGSRVVPLHELFLGPGATSMRDDEILTRLIVAAPEPGIRAVFLKKGRVKMDLSVASVAVLLVMEGNVCRKARVAAGSVGPTPLRLHEVESILVGATLDASLVAEAAAIAKRSVSPISDLRSTADYRRQLVGVFVRRAIGRLLGWEAA